MRRRSGIVCFVALSSLLLCGWTSPTGCTTTSTDPIGPSKGEVVGAAVGVVAVIVVGTVVLVKVHDVHHTIQGCVTSGPDGLVVHSQKDGKSYLVTGVTAGVKVGDVVKLHGTKHEDKKDPANGEKFTIEKMNRDLGPCPANPAP